MATKAKTRHATAQRKSSRAPGASGKRKSREASSNAFHLLEQDHREVEEWFDQYNELNEHDDRKAELAQKICLALKVHAQIEEEIFYPQAREATKDNDLIDEAMVEHATVKNLIAEIESMKVGEELYDAKIRVLGEMVKQHIKDEEEELFPELQSAKFDVDAVGRELTERKQELISEYGLPEPDFEAIYFDEIVDRAADAVEQEERVVIEREARDLLIRRAEEHDQEIRKALRDRGWSKADLEYAAADQFKEALFDAGGSRIQIETIGIAAVESGMTRKCHFVPWC